MALHQDTTGRKRGGAGKYALALLLSVGISLLGAEALLRAARYRPWRPQTLDVSVEPGGRLFYVDKTLGYTQRPGRFQFTHGSGYTWTATHGPDAHRVTETKDATRTEDTRPAIWVFGCSYTYGFSVNDHETYPWLLQARMPDNDVVNFGVAGYGTINSFLQFRQALETRAKPEVVVVAYAPFHDARNMSLRRRAKAAGWYSRALGDRWRPYARLASDGSVIIDVSELEYREFPLMRHSALMHVVEKAYNNLEVRYVNGSQVSRTLLGEFSKLASENGIRFVVAAIDEGSNDMLDALGRDRIETVDISVDLTEDGYRNTPHDSHPSFKAHKLYAQKLSAHLERSTPRTGE